MRLPVLAAAATIMLAGSAQAHAQASEQKTSDHRFYASLHAGQDVQDDESIRGANAANLPRNNDLTFTDGRVYAAALGVNASEGDWGRLRLDAELSQREADVETIRLNNVQHTIRQGSHVLITAAMLNGYYDTPVYWDHLRFYAGGGIGIATIDHQVRYQITGGAAPSNAQIAIPTSEPTWAYQLVGGGEYILSPNWSLLADVRYVTFGGHQIERFNLTAGALDSVNDVADKSSVSMTAGLRFSF
jgi:opacity protein-like surface antigen